MRRPWASRCVQNIINASTHYEVRYSAGRRRPFSQESHYIEQWQKQQIRDKEFYAAWAEKRHYFYTVDLQGRLYLEETSPKNIATSLKSPKATPSAVTHVLVKVTLLCCLVCLCHPQRHSLKNSHLVFQFLKFFFERLKRNDTGFHPEYIFASPCGSELNFIKPADTPFVFTDLNEAGELQVGDPVSVTAQFDPSALHVSTSSGRLYHPMTLKPEKESNQEGDVFGLIRSQLAVRLSEHMQFDNDEEEDGSASGDVGAIEWEGDVHPLRVLPPAADVAVALT